MFNSSTKETKSHFTPRATLVALGAKTEQMGIIKTIAEQVQIKQKTVEDSPIDKLTDAFITILAGGKGLVEANKRVRPDRAVQRAFGRHRCAEQSVISETLNACTSENVAQMESALRTIYQAHSAGYAHNYQQDWQLLDVDLSSQPCGKKAKFATKGYFAYQRNRCGRQLGRVLATHYNEVVVDRLYPGNTTLPVVLQELVSTAAEVLELDRSKRQRTILRIDGHGGSQDDVNWALSQGYHLLTKEYNASRARELADSVTTWYDDPGLPGRQVGWVTTPADEYVRPLKRIAVRCRKKNGQWGIGVLLVSFSPQTAAYLAGLQPDELPPQLFQLLAYLYLYDLRSGGIETSIKEDKQGLGITKRNKKHFPAQQMLVCLNTQAHNLLVWFQQAVAPLCPFILQMGLLRLLRDILHFNGLVFFNDDLTISLIVLSAVEPFAIQLRDALRFLLTPLHIAVILDKT